MKFYFAPMESLTAAAFRQVHSSMFPGVDRYYTPFIAPDTQGNFKPKFLRELLPDRNLGIPLVPQLLVNHPEVFLTVTQKLADLGYEEVNLNAGCPSGVVFPKHKGAGMLADPDALDAFLDTVFSRTPLPVSIKTRMGVESTEEFPRILEVYRRYPLAELIVHARHRTGFYKSRPDLEGFAKACTGLPFPVCYNGNVFSPAELTRVKDAVPTLERVMVGRGAIANPALIRTLQGGAPVTREEFIQFHNRLVEALLAGGLAPNYTVSHMKEMWFYMSAMFEGCEKQLKTLNKTLRLPEYQAAALALLQDGDFRPERCFFGTEN